MCVICFVAKSGRILDARGVVPLATTSEAIAETAPAAGNITPCPQNSRRQVGDSFIYVAGEDAAKQEGLVRHVGVTHIINCAGPQCPNYLEYVSPFTNSFCFRRSRKKRSQVSDPCGELNVPLEYGWCGIWGATAAGRHSIAAGSIGWSRAALILSSTRLARHGQSCLDLLLMCRVDVVLSSTTLR